MQTVALDLYTLDELDERAREAAHDEYLYAMGGVAEDLQNEDWEQAQALQRFLKAVPWARGSWQSMHGPGTERWAFERVDPLEAAGRLDARPGDGPSWYDYAPAHAFAEAMDERAEALERAEAVMRAYLDYQEELAPGEPDGMIYDAMQAEDDISRLCEEALEAAARAINEDWEAARDHCYSLEHFEDLSAANEWYYTADGSFYGHC